jgi:hypothetical protein
MMHNVGTRIGRRYNFLVGRTLGIGGSAGEFGIREGDFVEVM